MTQASQTLEGILSQISLEPMTGCGLWGGGVDSDGYALISWSGATRRGTRLLWTLLRGEIPRDMLVCHKCDQPSCMNIEHMFLGTSKENTRDMILKGRAVYAGPKNPPRGPAHRLYGTWKHGTASGYQKHKCRCEECRLAWRTYRRLWREKNKTKPYHGHKCGTLTGYHHHRCRCVECQRAQRDYRRAHDVSQRAKGVCRECNAPLSPRSKNFCVDHLDKHRRRMNARNARLRATIAEQG